MTDVHKSNVTADVLRDMVDEARVVYNWQQIEERRHRGRNSFTRTKMVLAVSILLIISALAAGLLLLGSNTRNDHSPLAFEIAGATRMLAVPSKATSGRHIPLSDGSTITLAPGASLEVMTNTASRFRTTLHEGWVRYNVIPGHERKWEVDAGLCRVMVWGTQFTVNRTPERVDVMVHRGTVAVYAPQSDHRLATLTKGNSYTIRYPHLNTKRHIYIADASVESEPTEDYAQPANTLDGKHSGRDDKISWKNTRRSKVATRTEGTALVGLGGSAAVNELLKQVDIARTNNQPRKAARLLTHIIQQYPSDQAIGLVALTLGKIQLDTLKQPVKAARAFERATVSQGLPSPLREQAFARGVEAYHRAGNIAAAQQMGASYQSRYPNGSWRGFVERWITP